MDSVSILAVGPQRRCGDNIEMGKTLKHKREIGSKESVAKAALKRVFATCDGFVER